MISYFALDHVVGIVQLFRTVTIVKMSTELTDSFMLLRNLRHAVKQGLSSEASQKPLPRPVRRTSSVIWSSSQAAVDGYPGQAKPRVRDTLEDPEVDAASLYNLSYKGCCSSRWRIYMWYFLWKLNVNACAQLVKHVCTYLPGNFNLQLCPHSNNGCCFRVGMQHPHWNANSAMN